MKKVLLIAIGAIALMTSCQDKTAYVITGTVADVADSTKVMLTDDLTTNRATDSTTVKGGKFSFEGKQKESAIQYLIIKGKQMRPIAFVLEPGKIAISIGEESKVSGTLLNDRNSSFTEKVKSIKDYESFTKELNSFIKENADNVLGVYYFTSNFYMFDLESQKELYALIPDTSKGTERMDNIKVNIDQQELTAIGKKYIDVAGLTPEGKEVALSNYVGKSKIILIDFWASWCGPCRVEMPHLVDIYAKYKGKGLEIVGISLDRTNEAWVQGTKDLKITWPQMSDLNYFDSELSKPYAISSIPYTILLDKEGTIIAKKISGKELDAKLVELLGK